jgi:plastocyanin
MAPVARRCQGVLHTMEIRDKVFLPQNLTIERGDQVEFKVVEEGSFNNYVI